MDVSEVPLLVGWSLAGWIAGLAVLAYTIVTTPWKRLVRGQAALILPAAVFVLCVLWSVRGHLGNAFAFHLLLSAGLALAVGPPLALVGGVAVVGVLTLVRDAPILNAGLVWITAVAVPVAVVTGVLRFAERVLPPNFFVYVFTVCFFGAAAAYWAAGLSAALVLVGGGGQPAGVVFGEYVPFLIYLAFGEATVTGMLLTLAVVYLPGQVATFDDARYLHGR